MTLEIPNGAHRVEPERARDEEATAYQRAKDESIAVDPDDQRGHFRVRVGEGDVHEVVLVEDDESRVGWCDCDGFRYHEGDDRLPGGCCAHLCAVAMRDAIGDIVPSAEGHVVDPIVDELEPEIVEHSTGDQAERATDGGNAPAPAEPSGDLSNPFASTIEGVPDRFIMELGGDPYIRREGFQRLARSEGYAVRSELVTWASETDNEMAEARAEVLDDGDLVATGVGTAHLEAEDMDGAVGNLNELAETRAISRAMGWATGAGLAAVEAHAPEEFDDAAAQGGGRR